LEKLTGLMLDSGIAQITWGQAIMVVIGLVLLYLAIHRKFEPLLLVPIGFGTLLVNIPGAGLDQAPVLPVPVCWSLLEGCCGISIAPELKPDFFPC